MYNDEKMPDDKAINQINEEYQRQTKNDNFPIFLAQYLVKIKQNLATMTSMTESLRKGAKNPSNVKLLDNIAKLLSKNSIHVDKNQFFSVATQYRSSAVDNLRKVLIDMRRLNVETVDMLGDVVEKASNQLARDMLVNQLTIGYYLSNII